MFGLFYPSLVKRFYNYSPVIQIFSICSQFFKCVSTASSVFPKFCSVMFQIPSLYKWKRISRNRQKTSLYSCINSVTRQNPSCMFSVVKRIVYHWNQWKCFRNLPYLVQHITFANQNVFINIWIYTLCIPRDSVFVSLILYTFVLMGKNQKEYIRMNFTSTTMEFALN